MLTILDSYAQEESLSVSENQKWRVRHNFENGMPWNGTVLGYRYIQGTFEVEPAEAEIVRFIFDTYSKGIGATTIAKMLNQKKVPTRYGNEWHDTSVMGILRNYTYTGNLLLQTTYSENHLTKRMVPNNGELPQYHISNSHEPIIDLEQFNAVQKLISQRSEKHCPGGKKKNIYPFTGKLQCSICGKNYRRKKVRGKAVWICSTFNTRGRAFCSSKQIPEETLYRLSAEVLGMDHFDSGAFLSKITAVRVEKDNTLIFCFSDGTQSVKRWQNRSRRQSWTPEMKEAARKKELERRSHHEKC